jgi:hypothetical protein
MFPYSEGGRVSTKKDLSGEVGSTKISTSLKRILFEYNVFSIQKTIFFLFLESSLPACTLVPNVRATKWLFHVPEQ